MTDPLRRRLEVDLPLDLRATLRPLTFPWGRWAEDGWWRTARTPEGGVTCAIRRVGGAVEAEAWGDGAAWLLDRLPGWLGLCDQPDSFQPRHPLLAELHRRRRGQRYARTGLVFEALLVAIVAQKVTGKEAAGGLRGMARRFSEPAPGPRPDLWLPPDPALLAAAPYHRFHDLGVERRRAETVARAARVARALDGLVAREPGEARRVLESIRGVGVWSSAETVALSHGDPDAVSVGDFHHKHVVAWHLAGEPRGTDERMLELLDPFRPHRGRVVRLLETAGPYPRYGPRQPVRSFARY